MTDRDRVLFGYLSKASGMGADEYEALTEEFKEGTAKEMSKGILENIKRKLGGIDVTDIDRSRGDIKNYPELGSVQSALAKLKMIAEAADEGERDAQLESWIKESISAITNLNKAAPAFKEAYRSKKTLLMLRYQSVVLALLASVSYLVSVAIDFRDPDDLKLKPRIEVKEIAPLRSLAEFNKSVLNGDFSDIQKGVGTLREFYCEYSAEDMMTICEAVNVVDFINNGVAALTQNIRNNGRASAMLYKISSLIVLLLSLRDSFYSIGECKNKVSDYLNQIKTFVNIDNLPSISALSRFITTNNKVASNAEEATRVADEEIKNEDRGIITAARNAPSSLDSLTAFMPKPEPEAIGGTKEIIPIPEAEPEAKPDEYEPVKPGSPSDDDAKKAEANLLADFGF